MTHTPNVSEAGLNGLLDHAQAQAKALAKLENVVWFATELLLEADRLYRAYGAQHVPTDEAAQFVAGLRHYLLIAPALAPRPETPTGGTGVGEAPGPSVGNVDIAVEDDIARAIADLEGEGT